MARVLDDAISQAWLEAAKDLGIRVAAPFTVHSDEPILYEAHVVDFGGPKGTVVGVLDDKLDDCRALKAFTAQIWPPPTATMNANISSPL